VPVFGQQQHVNREDNYYRTSEENPEQQSSGHKSNKLEDNVKTILGVKD